MGITNPTQKASIVAKYYALTKGLKGLADAGALHRLRGTGLTRQDLLNMYRKHETTFDEDKFTKVLVNGVTLCLIGTFEGKSENDFIKEISGKVYVKAGTDSVDVINLQTRRTKRYKVQYT